MLFLPDRIGHVFKDRSYLFPHHLTSQHNVMITLCDCFCTFSVVALPAGSTSNSDQDSMVLVILRLLVWKDYRAGVTALQEQSICRDRDRSL